MFVVVQIAAGELHGPVSPLLPHLRHNYLTNSSAKCLDMHSKYLQSCQRLEYVHVSSSRRMTRGKLAVIYCVVAAQLGLARPKSP